MAYEFDIHLNRRLLLPTWIRFFSWLFLLLLAVPVVVLVGVFVMPDSFEAGVFGLSYVGSPLAPPALAIEAFLFFMGVAAYGLIRGRSWGLHAGLMAGVVGLGVAVFTMVASGFTTIQFEPLLQVPFIIALWRRRKAWPEGPAPALAHAA